MIALVGICLTTSAPPFGVFGSKTNRVGKSRDGNIVFAMPQCVGTLLDEVRVARVGITGRRAEDRSTERDRQQYSRPDVELLQHPMSTRSYHALDNNTTRRVFSWERGVST